MNESTIIDGVVVALVVALILWVSKGLWRGFVAFIKYVWSRPRAFNVWRKKRAQSHYVVVNEDRTAIDWGEKAPWLMRKGLHLPFSVRKLFTRSK